MRLNLKGPLRLPVSKHKGLYVPLILNVKF